MPTYNANLPWGGGTQDAPVRPPQYTGPAGGYVYGYGDDGKYYGGVTNRDKRNMETGVTSSPIGNTVPGPPKSNAQTFAPMGVGGNTSYSQGGGNDFGWADDYAAQNPAKKGLIGQAVDALKGAAKWVIDFVRAHPDMLLLGASVVASVIEGNREQDREDRENARQDDAYNIQKESWDAREDLRKLALTNLQNPSRSNIGSVAISGSTNPFMKGYAPLGMGANPTTQTTPPPAQPLPPMSPLQPPMDVTPRTTLGPPLTLGLTPPAAPNTNTQTAALRRRPLPPLGMV